MIRAFQHLLVVQQHHQQDAIALQRAIMLAEQHHSKITVVKSFYKALPNDVAGRLDTEQAEQAFIDQQKRIIQQQVDKLSTHNLALNIIISWRENAQRALEHLTQHTDITMIIKLQQQRHGILSLLPDWLEHYLIADCELPVWLVKASAAATEMHILACLDIDSELSTNAVLNDAILAIGHQLTRVQAEQLQVINCYCNDDLSMSMPYNNELGFTPLADAVRQHTEKLQPYLTQHHVRPEQLHLSEGLVDDEIPKAVQLLHTDLAIIGNNNMHRLSSALLGDTAHYLTAHTPCDVLIVKPHGAEQLLLATS
jgi:universal stress protein E